MRKFIAFVGSLAALLPATIGYAHDAPQRFTHEGRTYVYSEKQSGDLRVIDGRQFPSGSAFHLVVRGDAVSGIAGGLPVAFSATSAKGAARILQTGVQTAAR